jgi:hemerythrin-like domain-containing protein
MYADPALAPFARRTTLLVLDTSTYSQGNPFMDAKSVVRNAANAMITALAPESAAKPGTDILDTLKEEHNEVKSLLAQLQDASTSAQRKGLVKRIKIAMVPHSKAEQKILYNAVIALKDKDAQIDGHEGYMEHDLAAKTLQTLGGISNATSSEHKAVSKVLKELLEHHIDEEEKNVWKDAKKNFSEEDRERMNIAYLDAKRQVRIA